MQKNIKFWLKEQPTQIVTPFPEEGESIETKVRKIVEQGEPISDTAPIIYTAEKDGVLPQYDHRTDKQLLAIDATDKYAKSDIAKTDEDFSEVENPENKGKEE